MEEEEDPWGDEPDWARGDGTNTTETTTTTGQTTADGLNFHFGAQHILVLIDSAPSMFTPCVRIRNDNDDDERMTNSASSSGVGGGGLITPFDAALMACERLLLLRVHYMSTSNSSKRDGIGIMLYGMPPSSASSLLQKTHGTNNTNNITTNKNNTNNNHIKREQGVDSDDEEEDQDDDDDDEDELRRRSISSLSLIDIAPPGIEQIQTIRSYLLPRQYGLSDVGGDRTRQRRVRDLKAELYPTHKEEDVVLQSNNGIKEEESVTGGGGVMLDTDVAEEEEDEEEWQLCQLRVALYEASKAFGIASCVKKLAVTSQHPSDSKTIWIFTNRDNPTNGNDLEKEQVITAAKDVVDNGLDIRVWPLPIPPSSSSEQQLHKSTTTAFDCSLLFNHITTIQEGEPPPNLDIASSPGEPSSSQHSRGSVGAYFDLDSILEQIRIQWKRVRKVQTIPLLLPDWNLPSSCAKEKDSSDHAAPSSSTPAKTTTTTTTTPPSYPGIMLDLFQTTMIKRKPVPVVMTSKTNKRTNRTTQILSKDTGEIVESKHIRNYTEFGGERVPISKEEVGTIRRISNANPDTASLVLLGFKPVPSDISLFSLVDKSIFAYPNDEIVSGSRKAFTALHASMIRKGVMGIGELLLRVTSSSRLVAILPQQEERIVEENSQGIAISKQITPPGFNLIPLGFEDDIRATPRNTTHVDQNVVNATIDLIQNQNIDCGFELGESFSNPVLKSFWSYMESVSLGMPLQEDELEDNDTELHVEGILVSAGEQIKSLQLSLPEDEVVVKQRKRKAKVEVPDESGINWLNCYERDGLSDCKVDELKAYLRSVGEKVGGRKQEIIHRVKQHIEGGIANQVDRPKSAIMKAIVEEEDV